MRRKPLHTNNHEPDTPLPTQQGFKIWLHLPPIAGGLFILLTKGEYFVAYLGPFVGFWAVMDLWFMIMKFAHRVGATHYEVFDPKKNEKDSRIQ